MFEFWAVPSTGAAAAVQQDRLPLPPLLPPLPTTACALLPPGCAGQTCIGRPGTYSNRGTTFMDGADDVTQIDVPDVAAAMETCCSLCSSREDPDIGNCQAWDAFPAGDNAGLCLVGGLGWAEAALGSRAQRSWLVRPWLMCVCTNRHMWQASSPTRSSQALRSLYSTPCV